MQKLLPLVLLLAGCTAPVAPRASGGAPLRIVSTNPCADAMLVELVSPDRIAAISHYSQDPAATSMPIEVANRFATTAGTAEEVIAWTANWIARGGPTLNKPTHFAVRDGKF